MAISNNGLSLLSSMSWAQFGPFHSFKNNLLKGLQAKFVSCYLKNYHEITFNHCNKVNHRQIQRLQAMHYENRQILELNQQRKKGKVGTRERTATQYCRRLSFFLQLHNVCALPQLLLVPLDQCIQAAVNGSAKASCCKQECRARASQVERHFLLLFKQTQIPVLACMFALRITCVYNALSRMGSMTLHEILDPMVIQHALTIITRVFNKTHMQVTRILFQQAGVRSTY